jgi:hypothetical protein
MGQDKTHNISAPFKSWWAGDQRVEPFMIKLNAALARSGKNLTTYERTDIYNRAYEAVHEAIVKYDKKKVLG